MDLKQIAALPNVSINTLIPEFLLLLLLEG